MSTKLNVSGFWKDFCRNFNQISPKSTISQCGPRKTFIILFCCCCVQKKKKPHLHCLFGVLGHCHIWPQPPISTIVQLAQTHGALSRDLCSTLGLQRLLVTKQLPHTYIHSFKLKWFVPPPRALPECYQPFILGWCLPNSHHPPHNRRPSSPRARATIRAHSLKARTTTAAKRPKRVERALGFHPRASLFWFSCLL